MGLPGPATILEGRFGLYRTFLGAEPDPRPFDTLGHAWETLRDRATSRTRAAISTTRTSTARSSCAARTGVSAAAIESIECRVPAGEVPIVCEPAEVKRRPRTSYDAQFSLAYSVAAAFVDGKVGLDTYAPERLADPEILRVADRVRYVVDPDSTFPATFPGWVRVRLADGRELESRVPHGRGGPERPLPPEALVEKFRDNARRALPTARVAALEGAALGLDRLKSGRELMRLCRG